MHFVHRITAFFLTLLSFSPLACAHPSGPDARYTVSVRDENGRTLPTFHHDGQTFVLGTYGDRYTVHVENRTARRVEAVVTVDGRDVISGQAGDYVNQRGYLIDPYDALDIEGFRQSWDEVAAFRFSSPQGSYSARMGTPENVGVIGVAIFPERAREVIARPQPRRLPQASAPRSSQGLGTTGPREERSAGAGASSEGRDAYARDDAPRRKSAEAESLAAAPAPSTDNLGTEYGESLSSTVEEVAFRRANASQPEALIALRYDDRSGLLARGIAIDPPRPRPLRRTCGPQAFPTNSRFAPPPPPYCN